MWRLEGPGSLIDPLGELATFLWYTAAGDQVCVPTRSVGCDAMMDYRMEEIYGLVDEALKAAEDKVQLQAFPFRMTEKLPRHAIAATPIPAKLTRLPRAALSLLSSDHPRRGLFLQRISRLGLKPGPRPGWLQQCLARKYWCAGGTISLIGWWFFAVSISSFGHGCFVSKAESSSWLEPNRRK
jgi:hypothetical protein